jgi:hypothetical protein
MTSRTDGSMPLLSWTAVIDECFEVEMTKPQATKRASDSPRVRAAEALGG